MPDADDELTELYDATMPRVDIVGKGASGVPRWLVMKGAGGDTAGLMSPDYVRSLISKTSQEAPVPEAEAGRTVLPNGIHLSGSPAAMAAFIHAANVRKAEPEPDDKPGDGGVAKAELSAKAQNDLPDSAFAFIESGGTKDADGKTTPRSLRHFNISDKAHADNAAARIAQGAKFGDKAKPKVEAAQRKFGEKKVSKEAGVPETVTKDAAGGSLENAVDDGQDGLDPTAPLAAPDDLDDIPGDPMDPGSPAWESVDAATASKWTTILAWAKTAIGMLEEREITEAATVDPDDADNACDLDQACQAIDFAISQLAPYAVGEQSEADTGAADFEAIGKAAAAAEQPAQLIAGLVSVRKSGRVLSTANEAAIRGAVDSLQKVLASLPQAPVAKEKESAKMPQTKAAPVAKDTPSAEEQAADKGPEPSPGTTGLGEPRTTGPAEALPADGPQEQLPGDVPGRTVIKSALPVAVWDHTGQLFGVTAADSIVMKADGDKQMMAVFDAQGNLVGVVDPAKVQVVAGAGKKPEPEAKPDDDTQAPPDPAAAPASDDGPQPGPAAAAAPDPEDLEPQPSAAAGIPADDVAKSGGAHQNDASTVTQDVVKAVTEQVAKALESSQAAHAEVVAKMAADNAGLAETVEALKSRLETVENTPAMPKVALNGAVPPAQLRGQDQGAPVVDVAKAAQLRETLHNGSGPEQAQAFGEMASMARARLAEIRTGNRVQSPAVAS